MIHVVILTALLLLALSLRASGRVFHWWVLPGALALHWWLWNGGAESRFFQVVFAGFLATAIVDAWQLRNPVPRASLPPVERAAPAARRGPGERLTPATAGPGLPHGGGELTFGTVRGPRTVAQPSPFGPPAVGAPAAVAPASAASPATAAPLSPALAASAAPAPTAARPTAPARGEPTPPSASSARTGSPSGPPSGSLSGSLSGPLSGPLTGPPPASMPKGPAADLLAILSARATARQRAELWPQLRAPGECVVAPLEAAVRALAAPGHGPFGHEVRAGLRLDWEALAAPPGATVLALPCVGPALLGGHGAALVFVPTSLVGVKALDAARTRWVGRAVFVPWHLVLGEEGGVQAASRDILPGQFGPG